jgi:hypothetical protein
MAELSQRKCPLRRMEVYKSLHSGANVFPARTATGVPAPLPILYQLRNVGDVASIPRPTCKANGTFSTANLRNLKPIHMLQIFDK